MFRVSQSIKQKSRFPTASTFHKILTGFQNLSGLLH